jgi:hypothetical protein
MKIKGITNALNALLARITQSTTALQSMIACHVEEMRSQQELGTQAAVPVQSIAPK